ncbi:glycoside hydrolase family 127 protein [Streptomyces sp. NBC_00576]|uniref:glycoside hydrolase family 127 protein n=1 Tax=Streptomyces sp. NBC_00576 TaxID=2903665 RepID=UPI002E823A6C|nr:beta-L-arabinofuranosidase domain-containing protein [Streptomyces sp. NBC_00576]WUB76136.1 glycoside hydrolase family 127 protein [Streptomyces sp. NBC_00576]
MTENRELSTVLPVAPTRGRLRPLGLDEVRITGGFWARRRETNATATLAHCRDWMERTGWTGNFRAVAEGRIGRDRRGREFADSEIYKLLEAMAWQSGTGTNTHTGAALDADIAALTEAVASAQEPDGYLNTAFGHPGQQPRYSDLEWGHELYCYGFLIQAGIAQARTRGEGELTKVALRAADHICATFGRGGIESVCGHAEIETALVELARLTGEERYLDQAALFIDRRGHGTLADGEFGRVYHQDDQPVREATVLRGHAVRALYLASGAVDVAVETGDEELLAAVERQWAATAARRTYLTGGMGSHHRDEAFGDDFVLPPDRAYSETCAGVASVQLSWRLLLATGDPRYADLAERTLFNVVATSPSEDGRSFFYANTLHRRHRGAVPATDAVSPRAESSMRAPWFAVSCCPTNVARTLAQLPAHLATADDQGIQLHQYADAEIATTLTGGHDVALSVRTDYPSGGKVTVRIVRSSPARPLALSLRVPAWTEDATAYLVDPDGTCRTVPPGTAEVTRVFRPGDEIRLELPVAPRWIAPDARIDAVRGTVAVQRGPLVYCAESVDLPGGREADAVRVDPSAEPEDGPEGTVVAPGELVEQDGEQDGPGDPGWPYRPLDRATVSAAERTGIVLIPYNSWANRGPSTMRVWLPTTET